MSKTWFRYGLWGLTLATVWWVAAIVSALAGGKGLDKLRIPVDGTVSGAVSGLDTGAGEL